MKARLTHHAAPWLIALGMLASAPLYAEQSSTPPSPATSVLAQPAAQPATATPRVVWDRVGAPMQGLA